MQTGSWVVQWMVLCHVWLVLLCFLWDDVSVCVCSCHGMAFILPQLWIFVIKAPLGYFWKPVNLLTGLSNEEEPQDEELSV